VYSYVIEANRKHELLAHLAARGIGVENYYPIPLHLQPCFEHLGHRPGDFPNSERACERTVALPLYPELRLEQLERTVAAVREFYQRSDSP